MKSDKLAIEGGVPVRRKPLPSRRTFGKAELKMVKRVFDNSWKTGVDFFSQGKYEEMFTKKYCEFHGGGYADAVNSGTAAIYVAFQALDIESGSDVIVSPATNPGGIMPIVLQNVKMIISDSDPNSFNISPDNFEKSITPKTRAAVLTHLGGHPIDLYPIIEIAKAKGIKILEDCSQAHGALYKGKKVGTFTEISASSTMCSKTLTSGGNGGIIYTKNRDLHWHARSLADRGKPFLDPNYHFRITTNYLYPALNHNTDELSCAMGISSLAKLQKTIEKRSKIVKKIDQGLNSCSVVYPVNLALPDTKASIFFHTVGVKVEKLNVSKVQFAKAIAAEGLTLNTDYRDITCEWKWIPKYVTNYSHTRNTINFRDRSFNILFNENYGDKEIKDIIKSIIKVEKFYTR
jgi:dTDP-4-amino-4,6-dideoxygalactose transaminase